MEKVGAEEPVACPRSIRAAIRTPQPGSEVDAGHCLIRTVAQLRDRGRADPLGVHYGSGATAIGAWCRTGHRLQPRYNQTILFDLTYQKYRQVCMSFGASGVFCL